MRRKRWGVIASACLLIPTAWLRVCPAQSVIGAPTAACAADPQLPAFEVAAITAVAEKKRGETSIGQYGLSHFTMRNASLSLLLTFSFDIQPANFVNAPHGLDDAVFDVQVASADELPLTYEALKPRMQQLLEQRFCLKGQKGTRQVSGYALLRAKGGAKVMPGSTPGDARGSAYITQHEVSATNVDMASFASMLASPVGRPVQDQTGLKGNYIIRIHFAPTGDAESTLPSIFTALKEQAGLELKAAQVPVQTLVIEHLNLVPTEN